MDNLNKIDDALKKQQYIRALVIIVIIAVVTVWFSFIGSLSDRNDDKAKYDQRIDSINVAHKRDIDRINAFWDKKYNEQVEARLRDKDENIRKLEEKDREHSEQAGKLIRTTKAVKVKAERNDRKSKYLENSLTP